MYYCYLDTPIGELLLAGDEDALCFIGFPEGSMRLEPELDWIFTEKPFAAAQEQLTSYFAGERTRIADAGCAAITNNIKAEGIQIFLQTGMFEIV